MKLLTKPDNITETWVFLRNYVCKWFWIVSIFKEYEINQSNQTDSMIKELDKPIKEQR